MELQAIGQVANTLGIPFYRIEYLLRAGKLPDKSVRIGGRRVWTEEQVDEMREQLEQYEKSRSKSKNNDKEKV